MSKKIKILKKENPNNNKNNDKLCKAQTRKETIE